MFDKQKIRKWRKQVWRVLAREGFQPAHMNPVMVMAAVDVVGTNPALVSSLVGVSIDYVTKVLRRLRKQRVLSGQTLRVRWDEPGFEGRVAFILDAMVATGEVVRPPDEKRSAAQKARAPETRVRGPRGKRSQAPVGAFTPKHVKANPLDGLSEWRAGK
jgi:hypothetical protein